MAAVGRRTWKQDSIRHAWLVLQIVGALFVLLGLWVLVEVLSRV